MKPGFSLLLFLTYCLVGSSLQSSPTSAQVTPDGTTSTTINVEQNNFTIQNGDRAGSNLFHSFREFNIGDLERVDFANPTGIERIFSRVTGGNISNIDGVLGVLGNADLFFLNPNGIIFGQNASLDVNGSFIASTADSIVFGDEFSFSASNSTKVPPLLTVNPNVFLFSQTNTATIENRSIASAGVDFAGESVNGLRVPDGNSLLLLGGEILIDGGGLHALEGEIELAAIADLGKVELNFAGNDLSLNIPADLARADILLSNQALVNVNGEQGGEIEIGAKQLELRDGSQIRSNTLGEGNGENVIIDVNESIVIDGLITDPSSRSGLSASGLFVGTRGVGDAGNLTINAKNLLIEDGGQIGSNTFGQGNGGNILVNASESVEVIGTTEDGNLPSFFSALTFMGTGNAGDVTIVTPYLLLENGGNIATATGGEGNAGNITINSNLIEVVGRSTDSRIASRISTQSAVVAMGDAGDLTINTDNLSITNGAQVDSGTFSGGKGGNLTVSVSGLLQLSDSRKEFSLPTGIFTQTEGTGDAQNLTITTNKLIVQDGARISASTGNSGKAGDSKITAREIELIGITPDRQFGSGLFTSSFGTGDGGELAIATEQLSILDGAKISASSEDSGLAGNVQINAESINLDNGAITTETDAGDGGNIILQIEDLFLLRNNSQISTTAGNIEAGGDGGDITINSDLVAAIPREDSDITANAFNGRGGNINITTQGIFGLEFRAVPSPFNDITASSEFGLDGTVSINTPDVNPGEGLINLPTTFATLPLDTSCQATNSGNSSSFVNLGRGGLPKNPREIRSDREIWDDLRSPVLNGSPNRDFKTQSTKYNPIVEAQSWIVGDNGKIILVADVESGNSRDNYLDPCKKG